MGKKSHQRQSYSKQHNRDARVPGTGRASVSRRDALVAGESARSIMDAVVQGNRSFREDGSLAVSLSLPYQEAAPLVRAIMRVEAEFLLADADGLDTDRPVRAPEQRRADAFSALVDRAGAALFPDLVV